MRLWHRCFPVNFAKDLKTPLYRTPPDDCRGAEACSGGKCQTSKIEPFTKIVNDNFLKAIHFRCLIGS